MQIKCPFWEIFFDIKCPYIVEYNCCDEIEVNPGNSDAWCTAKIEEALNASKPSVEGRAATECTCKKPQYEVGPCINCGGLIPL